MSAYKNLLSQHDLILPARETTKPVLDTYQYLPNPTATSYQYLPNPTATSYQYLPNPTATSYRWVWQVLVGCAYVPAPSR